MVVTESLAKGLATKTLRELREEAFSDNEFRMAYKVQNSGYKKSKRELKRQCSTLSRLMFLEERNKEKSSWEVIWGSWDMYSGSNEPETLNDFDRMAFQLFFYRKLDNKPVNFNIILTKHALIRLLMRSGKELSSADDVLRFMEPITKELIWAGLSSLDGAPGRIIHAGDFYLPFIWRNNEPMMFIKNVLREDQLSRKDEVVDSPECRNTLFDYAPILSRSNKCNSLSFKDLQELKSKS